MVSGLRRVSSVMMATRSSRLGYLLLMSISSGPIVPGRLPPLMTWQVRQLPLLRSKASLLAFGRRGLRLRGACG